MKILWIVVALMLLSCSNPELGDEYKLYVDKAVELCADSHGFKNLHETGLFNPGTHIVYSMKYECDDGVGVRTWTWNVKP
jgi:hypothetical protein